MGILWLEAVMEKETKRQVPLVEHHPKAPDASPEHLRELAGSIPFTGEAPSTKFLDAENEDRAAERARD